MRKMPCRDSGRAFRRFLRRLRRTVTAAVSITIAFPGSIAVTFAGVVAATVLGMVAIAIAITIPIAAAVRLVVTSCGREFVSGEGNPGKQVAGSFRTAGIVTALLGGNRIIQHWNDQLGRPFQTDDGELTEGDVKFLVYVAG